MDETERSLIADTVIVMSGLRSEMQEFRGEMREYKTQTLLRITALEGEQMECQKNPSTCATARTVAAHLEGHRGGPGFVVSVWALCISALMCIFTILVTVIKRRY